MTAENTFLGELERTLVTSGRIQRGDYLITATAGRAINEGKGFIQFDNPDRVTNMSGWKFHVSVDGADIDVASRIAADVFNRHNVPAFKFVASNTARRFNTRETGGGQAGKTITAYDNGQQDWSQIMNELEVRFQEAGIRPGLEVQGDRPVAGSRFTYYRNDGSGEGRSYSDANDVNVKEHQRYNPGGSADPFADITVSPESYRAAVRTDGATRSARAGLWNQYSNHQGPDIRLDVSNMPEANRRAILEGMQRQGLGAEPYRSESLGRDFIRVRDPESVKLILEAQRPNLPQHIAHIGQPVLARSSNGVFEYRVFVPQGANEYTVGRMQDTLHQAGVRVERITTDAGTYFRTTDADSLVRMEQITKPTAPAAEPMARAAPTPRELPPQAMQTPAQPLNIQHTQQPQQKSLQRAAPAGDAAGLVTEATDDKRFRQQAGAGNLETPERANAIRSAQIKEQLEQQAAAKAAQASRVEPEYSPATKAEWSHTRVQNTGVMRGSQSLDQHQMRSDALATTPIVNEAPPMQHQTQRLPEQPKPMQMPQQQSLQRAITTADVAGPLPAADTRTLQDRLMDAITETSARNTQSGLRMTPRELTPDEIAESRRAYAADKMFGRTGVQKPKAVQRIEDLIQMEKWQRAQPSVPDTPEIPAHTARAAVPETPSIPHAPDAPHVPHSPKSRPRMVGGVAGGAVLSGGILAAVAYADQRPGETYGHAAERTFETSVTSMFNPIVNAANGDVAMTLGTLVDLVGVAGSAQVTEYRVGEAARSVTTEQKKDLASALPKGNMNLGSTNERLNLIAKLLAYRDQGTEHLALYSSPFSAMPGIAGEGIPGLVSEGHRVAKTSDLLDEHISKFIAEGGTMDSIREAVDHDYYKEQLYLRLRKVVPDQTSPGYTHFSIEARDGMQEIAAFRALVQSGADQRLPEARARGIELAYAYLMSQDFDEGRMLRNATYQMTRNSFLVARDEDLVAAGMGPLFNISGDPERRREDRENIMKVLSQPTGGPDGEQIFDRIIPGGDKVADPIDIYNALPPEMQAQLDIEKVRLASIAPVAAPVAAEPAPAPKPEPEPVEEIVVSGQRYKDAPFEKKLSGKQHKMLEESGLKSFIDSNGDGVLQLGELRAALEDAGVTIAENGKVSDQQLAQSLPQLLAARDEHGRNA